MIGFNILGQPPQIIKVTENILKDFPNIKYNLEPIIKLSLNNDAIYLISRQNRGIAEKDLNSLNQYIVKASEFARIPYTLIKNISYDIPKNFFKYGEWYNYAYFSLSPHTKTGKLSKYPLVLHFSTQKNRKKLKKYVFGSLFYLGNGEIGKAHIISKKNSNTLTIDCGIKASAFQILRIKHYNEETFLTNELYNYYRK